jgi:phosphatidylglycerol lysyltransferase
LYGRCSISPFLVGEDRQVVLLSDGGITGVVRRGRWAVMATEPATPAGTEALALEELLRSLRARLLRPVFAAVSTPELFQQAGMYCEPVAEDAMLQLDKFSLAGSRRASIRHSVTSARRAGLVVEEYGPQHAAGCAAVSAAWLATKRGGEMGFTLGRFDEVGAGPSDCRVAVDGDGRVVAFVTWRRFDDGRARVLDLMRRLPDAPNPSMDLLMGESLIGFAAAGVERASLGSVPLSHGRLAERIYPTRSLRRFKDKFAPDWQPRYLAAPTRARLPGALMAVARAYSSGGLVRALRRNG